MKYSAAICDDDALHRDIISDMLSSYIEERGVDAAVSCFSSGEELVEAVREHGAFSLTVLDMIMPGLNGIETAKQLRSMGMNGPIIFLTGTTDYVLDSYDVHAYHYLVKPVGAEKLYGVLDSLITDLRHDAEREMELNCKNGKHRISANRINCIERVEKTVEYHIDGGRKLVSTIRGSFSSAVAEFLAIPEFISAGKSMLINRNLIRSVNKKTGEVQMKDGTVLRPPSSSMDEILDGWTN